jgi:long-chain acyl-CoA synthetase
MSQAVPGYDAIRAGLTAPGAPFELRTVDIGGSPRRVFCNAPQTLGDIYRAAAQYEARVLTVADGAYMTYGDALRKAAALGQFIARSVGEPLRGARIAIAMHNRPEWMLAFIAVTSLGASAVLINSRGTAAEINAALDETGAALVIADEQRAQLASADGRARRLIVARAANSTQPLPAQWTDFESAIANWETATLTPAPVEPEDEAVVMFTSGTTGGAKGALLSHRSVLTGLMNIQYSMAVVGAQLTALYGAEAMAAAAQRQPSALLSVPLFHSSGCYAVFLSNFMRGGKIVILPKWNAEQAVDLIEREQVAAFSGSPTMLWDLLRSDRAGRDLGALISVGIGGQALQPQLMREIIAAFPRAILGAGYGMTEVNGSVCMVAGRELLERPTTSGRIIPSAEVKIVDDDGAEVPTGGIGEIWVRGAMLMHGYCNRPEATAEVLRDGWLRTGDLARLDADGYLHVVDRKKDIVISGGENISLTEVEGAVIEHSAVAEAAAFGIADDRLGERLVMAVVVKAGHDLDAETLKQHVAQQLAIYKVPREVFFCGPLQRNALGKVNRNELRRQFLEQQPRA